MIRPWHHFVGRAERPSADLPLEALKSAGIETRPLEPGAVGGPGLLFFDEVTSRCCEFLRDISRGGIDRVLAIALSGTELAGGGAWRLLRAGASDVILWDPAHNPAAEAAARLDRWESVDSLVSSALVKKNLVGQSRAWTSAMRQVVEVARFTDSSVLILGESGTGKELVARLIHTLDQRPSKRELVVLDCTTIVPDLSGSEFFGHDRGAFTGAVAARDGAFALADKGTLFLDEVGELPLSLQAELLRVVQEHTYKRVGSNTWHHTDFRLVCATNRDLPGEESRGEFRRDFYYRIAGWTCRLPPLSERVEDILPLARHFIQQLKPDQEPLELDDSVRDYLLARAYPGNVRDLKQLVSRMVHRHVGPGPLTVGDIPEEERPESEGQDSDWSDESLERAVRRALSQGLGLKEIGRAAEEVAERIAVADEDGNLQRAARRLGVTDRALQMRKASRRGGNGSRGPDSTADRDDGAEG